MKKQIALAAALLSLSFSLTACAGKTVVLEGEQTSTSVTSIVQPVIAQNKSAEKIDLSQLSRNSNGYGQGVQVDEQNRTTGALDFNASYKKLNATAIDEDSDKITLTFDQGYENGYTAKILDTLKEKKVKAVFFLLQDYAEKNPDLVKRMIDEGHIIGNHSVHHYSMPTLDEETCKTEIMDFHKYMQDNYNYNMTLFRPPMGEYSEFSLGVTANCGYKSVLWSFAYADWDTANQPDKATSSDKLINAAHKGAIYLLHSVSQTNTEILGDVIDGIREKGFEFN